MEESYLITQEIKSPAKVGLWIYASDFFFLMFYIFLTWTIKDRVVPELRVLFYIFSGFVGIYLTLPSIFNRKRRNYQSAILLVKKDSDVYKPVMAKDKKKVN